MVYMFGDETEQRQVPCSESFTRFMLRLEALEPTDDLELHTQPSDMMDLASPQSIQAGGENFEDPQVAAVGDLREEQPPVPEGME